LKTYLNSREAGEMIRRSPAAIRNLVLRKQIPFRKVAGRLVFLRSELEQWVEGSPGVRLEET
jgi:hypothetical protein